MPSTEFPAEVGGLLRRLRDRLALHGPWPPPGLGPVPVADLQAPVHGEITGYWRRLSSKRRPWLHDSWVDQAWSCCPRCCLADRR